MYDLCVLHGWCGSAINGVPLHVKDFIPDEGKVSAEQFVNWLITADGIDPSSKDSQIRQWKRELVEIFIKHMKADVVDAKLLRSNW